jgi:hypothetical protein
MAAPENTRSISKNETRRTGSPPSNAPVVKTKAIEIEDKRVYEWIFGPAVAISGLPTSRQKLVLEPLLICFLEPVEPRDIIVSKIQPTCVSKQASICADRKQPEWCSIAIEHGVMLSWRWYTGSVGLPHVEVSQ